MVHSFFYSAFAFEGMLNFCGSLLHGTRFYGNQIGQHLGVENFLNFEAEVQLSKMTNLQLKTLCQKLRNSIKTKIGLLGSTFISSIENIIDMRTYENLIENSFNFNSNVIVTSIAVFENIGMQLKFF